MSDYLSRLAKRASGRGDTVRPRLRSFFEPAWVTPGVGAGWLESSVPEGARAMSGSLPLVPGDGEPTRPRTAVRQPRVQLPGAGTPHGPPAPGDGSPETAPIPLARSGSQAPPPARPPVAGAVREPAPGQSPPTIPPDESRAEEQEIKEPEAARRRRPKMPAPAHPRTDDAAGGGKRDGESRGVVTAEPPRRVAGKAGRAERAGLIAPPTDLPSGASLRPAVAADQATPPPEAGRSGAEYRKGPHQVPTAEPPRRVAGKAGKAERAGLIAPSPDLPPSTKLRSSSGHTRSAPRSGRSGTERRAEATAPDPVINITIGRIEVRAVPPPRNERAPSPRIDRAVKPQSLNEYLRRRQASR